MGGGDLRAAEFVAGVEGGGRRGGRDGGRSRHCFVQFGMDLERLRGCGLFVCTRDCFKITLRLI